MDISNRFSVSNRSIHMLLQNSNCGWWHVVSRKKKGGFAKSVTSPFTYISATRPAITKRTPPFEFPHQILNAPSNGVLIMGAAPVSVYLKIVKIGLIRDIFSHFSTTSGDTGNWMIQADSMDRTGLTILWKGLLIITEGIHERRL